MYKKKFALLTLLALSSCSNSVVALKDDNDGRKVLVTVGGSVTESPLEFYTVLPYHNYGHPGIYEIEASFWNGDYIATTGYQSFPFDPRDYGFERLNFGDIFAYSKWKNPNHLVYYPPKYEMFKLTISDFVHHEWDEYDINAGTLHFEDDEAIFVDEDNEICDFLIIENVYCVDGTVKDTVDYPIGTELIGYWWNDYINWHDRNREFNKKINYIYLFERDYFTKPFNWGLVEFVEG